LDLRDGVASSEIPEKKPKKDRIPGKTQVRRQTPEVKVSRPRRDLEISAMKQKKGGFKTYESQQKKREGVEG